MANLFMRNTTNYNKILNEAHEDFDDVFKSD
jgi:hypothetical protein